MAILIYLLLNLAQHFDIWILLPVLQGLEYPAANTSRSPSRFSTTAPVETVLHEPHEASMPARL
jgi:hypothetical protein